MSDLRSPTFTSTHLSLSHLNSEVLEELAKLKNITSLRLSLFHVNSKVVRELAKLQNRTSLRLVNVSVNVNVDSEVAGELAKLKNLTSLHLVGCDLDDKGAKELAKLKDLTSLRLRECNTNSEVVGELLAKLKKPDEISQNHPRKEIKLKGNSSKGAAGGILAKREKSEDIIATKDSQEISTGPGNLAPVLNNGQEINPVIGTTVHDNKSNVEQVKAANPDTKASAGIDNKDSAKVVHLVANEDSEQVSNTQGNIKQHSYPGKGNTAPQNARSKWPVIAVSTLVVAAVASVAISVYLEMLMVGIAVGACCLVAAVIIYYCNRPSNSLKNSSAEALGNEVQKVVNPT